MNYTVSTNVHRDVLTLTFERVLGYLDGGLPVPNGTLRLVALFANSTLAPAAALVDGQPQLVPREPGSYTLKLEAELWGARDETTVTVYAAPEEPYTSTIQLLGGLGEPSHLAGTLKQAVLSGRRGKIKALVDT